MLSSALCVYMKVAFLVEAGILLPRVTTSSKKKGEKHCSVTFLNLTLNRLKLTDIRALVSYSYEPHSYTRKYTDIFPGKNSSSEFSLYHSKYFKSKCPNALIFFLLCCCLISFHFVTES